MLPKVFMILRIREKRVRKLVGRFLVTGEGATSIEYALIASLIVIAIVLSVSALGNNVNNLWQLVAAIP